MTLDEALDEAPVRHVEALHDVGDALAHEGELARLLVCPQEVERLLLALAGLDELLRAEEHIVQALHRVLRRWRGV